MQIQTVGIAGLGLLGRGIAACFLSRGFHVIAFTRRQSTHDEARRYIAQAIDDLIEYAQSEIDKAKEIKADISAAEVKLEQAKQALAREDNQMVQYLVDDAVWLAKSSSIGQTSIVNMKLMAAKCSGHTVTLTGTINDLRARPEVGYIFELDDGTDRITVAYQGTAVDIGNEYEVRVTGIFDAPRQTVTASSMEKISGPSTPPESDTTSVTGITWSIELITAIVTICGAAVGVSAWMVRTQRTSRRRKILFKKLVDEVDEVYSRFRMNARRCEAELYKLRDQALDGLQQGVVDENSYNVLENRIDDYLKEIGEEIESEKP